MRMQLWLAACLAASPAVAAGGPPADPQVAATGAAAPAEVAYAVVRRGSEVVKVPLFAAESAATPIAQVGDDVIHLRELTEAIAGVHESQHAPGAKAGKKDFEPILDRLIDVHLLVAEGRDMGIAELPEVVQAVEEFKETAARQMLQATAVRGVAADPAEVERLYRERVREWKVRSILVASEPEAQAARARIEGGRSFAEVAKKLVAEKKAKGSGEGEWLPRAKMLPQILAALEKMKTGAVSRPIEVKDGFAVLQVEAVRYPDDPKARAEAESASRSRRQKEALKRYYDGLVAKYATVDRALLKKLDLEAKKPGLEALRKDQRTIAAIQGAEPITVAQLTEEIERSFYHGVQGAIRERRVNRQKLEAFDALLSRRIVPLQARAQGIPESPELHEKVRAHEGQLVFSKVIEKAIVPELKTSEAELNDYYQQHKAEFSYPTFYRLENIAFADVKQAQAAVEKLRSGTDWKWLGANAEGQVPEAQRAVHLEGDVVSERALPSELAKTLAGARKGDYRLHAASPVETDVLRVVEVVAAQRQPFAEVRNDIAQKVFAAKLQEAVKAWCDKLRKAHAVNVYITKIES